MKTTTTISNRLASFMLPGLETTMQELMGAVNEMRSQTGLPTYRLTADGTAESIETPRKKRHISAAGRRAIAAAQRKRWAAKSGVTEQPTEQPPGQKFNRSGRAMATTEQLLSFAREHNGVLDTKEFKDAHPGVSVATLGGLTRNGYVKKTGKGIFKLTRKSK